MPRVDVRRGNVTACTRCKSRKQRCDQQLPACSQCRRAGVDCVGFDTVTGRVAPRSYLKSLEDRVAFLEKKLHDHGIDLHSPSGGQHLSPSPAGVCTSPQNETHSVCTGTSNQNAALGVEAAVQQTSFASLSATTFPRSLVAGCGLSVTRVLFAEIGVDLHALQSSSANIAEEHGDIDSLSLPTALNQLPGRESAAKLVQIYFDHSDWFLPVLRRMRFQDDLEETYRDRFDGLVPNGAEHRFFRCFMVMAIGVLLLIKKDSSTPYLISDQLLTSATKIIEERPVAIFSGDLDHLEVLVLLGQFISLHPRASGVWHIVGLATRLAVDLGLHDAPPVSEFSPPELDRRKRLFWAAYSLELNICTVTGRPCSIPDNSISVGYPTDIEQVLDSGGHPIDPGEQILMNNIAIWIICGRRLEFEIHSQLFQAVPCEYPAFDLSTWQSNMSGRLEQWYTNRPASTDPVHQNVFGGLYSSIAVLLHSPNKFRPFLSLSEAVTLTRSAIDSVNYYREGFRRGMLRFYWRTVHKLFLAGMSILYCICKAPGLEAEVPTRDLCAATAACSSVLWGMVERHPPGKKCRDIFDQMNQRVNHRNLDFFSGTMADNPAYRMPEPPGPFQSFITDSLLSWPLAPNLYDLLTTDYSQTDTDLERYI